MRKPLIIMAGQSNATALYGGNKGVSLAETLSGFPGQSSAETRLVAANGAPLTYARSSEDWYHSVELANTLIATVRSALDADPDLYFAGILWVQGEADSHAVARATEYGARMCALVDRLAAGLADLGARTEDFRVSLLALSEASAVGATRPQWTEIRQQQLSIDHPRITVTDPDRLSGIDAPTDRPLFQSDGLHYRADANALVQTALIEGLQQALSPPETPPDAPPQSRPQMPRPEPVDIEHLRGTSEADVLEGSEGPERLHGFGGDDTLWGRSGDDWLFGGGGNDVLIGGKGSDTLTGGFGADRFVFFFEGYGGRHGTDTITDFQPGRDVIDLRFIDADPASPGSQPLHLRDAPRGAGAPGSLWVTPDAQGVRVWYDVDGDNRADGEILVKSLSFLDASDFLL